MAAGSSTKPPIPVSTGPDGYTYFPNGNTNPSVMQYPMDGRMIALASAGNATLSGTSINIKCGAPAGASTMEIGIFDGDQRSPASGGGNWDQGGGSRTIYQLFPNPTNGRWEDLPAGTQPLVTWTSDAMADNAWVTLNDDGSVTQGIAAGVNNRSGAQAASGNYFYILHIYLETPSVTGMINCFKVRARSPMSISPTNFGILGAYNGTAAETAALFPSAGVTTYDGTWTFFQDVPQSTPTFGIWDGDFDYGDLNSYYDWSTNPPTPHTTNADGPRLDTTDADTQTLLQQQGISNGIPAFAQTTVGVVGEGIGKGTKVAGNATAFRSGSPADDNASATLRRSPSICYDIVDPNGNVYTNPNPSGNAEWEHFSISSDPSATPATADYGPGWGTSTEYGNDPLTPVSARQVYAANGIVAGQNLSAGTWEMVIRGMDLGNLNTILPEFDLLGVTQDGVPIAPLRPYTIQGLVSNGCDGTALKGITIDLQDAVTGALQAQTTTDANGAYVFWVAGGSYTVAVDATSLAAGWSGNGGVSSQTLTVAGANGSASFVLMPPPVLTGVLSLTTTTDPGVCGWRSSNLPKPTGNCSVVSLTNDAPAILPVGVTTVTWTGTDGSGRTTTYVQTVTVVDKEAPVFNASSAVTLNTDPGKCTATLPVPNVTDNCSGTLTPVGNAPSVLPTGLTVVTWTATDAVGNTASFTQDVFVYDTEAPTIVCPTDVAAGTDAGKCSASNVALGNPITSDNCGISQVGNDAPSEFPVGTTQVTWFVIDNSGNVATCTQNVTVTDSEPPTITAPADVNANTDAGKCSASSVTLGTPTTADNCGVKSVTNNAPATFPVGTTTVTWTATDNNGNTATATQKVTVTDNQNPTITAPAAQTVSMDAGKCTASKVALGTPTTADNCGVASVTNNAPATYPAGVTTVTWTVTDNSGNTATTTQKVTVLDNEKPTITCPADVTVQAASGATSVSNVTLGTPTTGDNCGVASVTNNAPASYPVGTTTVTWTVTDTSGNTATCTQNVIVTPGSNSGSGAFTTFTQGGWGTKPAGNNPGTLLVNNFTKIYGSAGVKIGGKYTLSFTSAAAVQAFLPQGGGASALTKSQTNPTGKITVLAGQILSVQLDVDFSNAGVNRNGLANLKIQSGVFAGKTVSQFLTIANQALGGASTGYNLADINSTADSINQNFDNGTQNNGFLK